MSLTLSLTLTLRRVPVGIVLGILGQRGLDGRAHELAWEMQGRCRGDAREIYGRCRGEVGER